MRYGLAGETVVAPAFGQLLPFKGEGLIETFAVGYPAPLIGEGRTGRCGASLRDASRVGDTVPTERGGRDRFLAISTLRNVRHELIT